jgi:hypothetical protein
LGAIGVLPKQVKHADVSKALEQLNLLGEPTPERDLGLMPTLPELEPPLRRATDRLPPMAPELRAAIETILRDHTYELRRFVVENLESTADRIIGDVRLMLKDEVVPPPPPPPQASVVGAWLTVLAVLLAAIFAAQWWREAAYNSALTAQLQSARAPAGALLAAPGTSNALNAPSAPESAAAPAPESQLIEPVPFGEMPLGGARIDRVQALFARLNAQNFRGTVQIRTYPGRFCLQGSGDTATLAPSDTPYAKCDGIGNPRDEGSSPSQRESVAFANMLAAWRKSIDGAFDIEVSAAGADEVAEPYPPLTDALTAGDWNHAAAANNRVEVRWQAAP